MIVTPLGAAISALTTRSQVSNFVPSLELVAIKSGFAFRNILTEESFQEGREI